jgi:hypothetical protein
VSRRMAVAVTSSTYRRAAAQTTKVQLCVSWGSWLNKEQPWFQGHMRRRVCTEREVMADVVTAQPQESLRCCRAEFRSAGVGAALSEC